MKTFEITAELRPSLGKTGSKKVRKTGKVPCVVYGNGQPQHISVDALPLKKLFHSPETFLVAINVDGQNTNAVVREAQFHPVFDHVLHVDFIRVAEDKPVDVELPVKLTGAAKGVLAGGKLLTLSRKLKVRGLVSKMPENITIDVTPMELGTTFKVSDLVVEGLEFLNPANQGIVSVNVPRAAKEEIATAAAPAAAPAAAAEKAKK